MNFKKAFKVALAKKDLSQKDISEKMGVSPTYVSDMIAGKKNVTMNFFFHFADKVGCKPSELMALGE